MCVCVCVCVGVCVWACCLYVSMCGQGRISPMYVDVKVKASLS